MATAQMKKENYFLYVGDPMCSWCYGFSGELKKIADHYQDRFDVNVVVGGLRPFTEEAWDSDLREFLKQHWIEIGERTGEAFNLSILNDHGFVYDTEPACRAYKVLESLGADKLTAFHVVQKLFYQHNKDPKQVEAYKEICTEHNIGFKAFKEKFESETFREKTKQDFSLAQQLNVSGFPTLLLMYNEQLYVLTRGYQDSERIIKAVDGLLN